MATVSPADDRLPDGRDDRGANPDPRGAAMNGANGADGAAGADGQRGLEGATGATGATGQPGAAGQPGGPGGPGGPGRSGDRGSTGAKGDTGAPGGRGRPGQRRWTQILAYGVLVGAAAFSIGQNYRSQRNSARSIRAIAVQNCEAVNANRSILRDRISREDGAKKIGISHRDSLRDLDRLTPSDCARVK